MGELPGRLRLSLNLWRQPCCCGRPSQPRLTQVVAAAGGGGRPNSQAGLEMAAAVDKQRWQLRSRPWPQPASDVRSIGVRVAAEVPAEVAAAAGRDRPSSRLWSAAAEVANRVGCKYQHCNRDSRRCPGFCSHGSRDLRRRNGRSCGIRVRGSSGRHCGCSNGKRYRGRGSQQHSWRQTQGGEAVVVGEPLGRRRSSTNLRQQPCCCYRDSDGTAVAAGHPSLWAWRPRLQTRPC